MGDITDRTPRLSLASLRQNYTRAGLDETDCEPDPIQQFERWFLEAQAAEIKEPNAMVLATATPEGKPSARVVLLKGISPDGFVFYTNYLSRKGRDLATNPFASLTFFWAELERQVRIEGSVVLLPRAESEAYFRTRPRGSQLGAWVSRQSDQLASRAELESTLDTLERQFAGIDQLPTPEHWGGYRLKPDAVEFWQGRPNRLHDRLLYQRKGENGWLIQRLWP
jgi:pyridoxamine 5'-phosphate oxidase